jgi:competence protein ComEA
MSSSMITSRKSHGLLAAALVASLCTLGAVAHAETAATTGTAKTAAVAPAAVSGVVNVNTATAEELDRLPGVGPGRAKAILELRAHMKHFEKLEDLMRVKGIGRASFRKLRPMLTLTGETTLVGKAAHPSHAPAPHAS